MYSCDCQVLEIRKQASFCESGSGTYLTAFHRLRDSCKVKYFLLWKFLAKAAPTVICDTNFLLLNTFKPLSG